MTKVIIKPTKIGAYGQLYSVTLEDGSILLEDSRNPGYDSCRALHSRGIAGSLEVYRGRQLAFCIQDIAEGAKLTISETSRDGLQVTAWRPVPIPREGKLLASEPA
jgi:hypothetical protein